MSVQIQSQSTPNPNARKFVLPEKRFAQAQNFSAAPDAADQPLVAELFALGGIYNVFLAQDFITVNKLPAVPWAALDEQIQLTIIAHFTAESRT